MDVQPARWEDDLVDGVQEHVLPNFVDGPIDAGQTASQTVTGAATTVAGATIDAGIAAGEATVDGVVDAGEAVVDGFESLVRWRP